MKKPRNQFEKKINTQLRRAKATFKYESRKIPYVRAHHYIPDFEIVLPNGVLLLECKGYFRQEDKAKLAAVKRQHPELDLRIVFYAKNEKNLKWCEKHGIKCAIGKIPREWLKGM